MRTRRTRSAWAALAVTMAALAVAGCQKPLFPEDAPRTPYDRYLTLRGQQAAAEQRRSPIDPGPPLRERLRPLGQP